MTPRVVHVASGREWRGGQRQVWLLARALARRGTVPQVVVTGRGSELARRLAADRVPLRDAAWHSALDPRALLAACRAAERHGILHAHDGHALTLAWAAARLTGAHLVATRRVDFPLRRAGLWTRTDRVIAISAAVRDALLAGGVAPSRIALVHSGIDVEGLARTRPRDPRPSLGLAPGTPLAITTGALVRHKDHATLIRAAAIAAALRPDLHWAIAGSGYLRPELERLIAETGTAARVHLLGEVPDAESLVASADLFVMSSREEGLGTSVLNAMALGVPVVGTRAGGIPEMLEGGAGRLVAVGDAEALARAVVEVLADADGRSRMVEQARTAVRRFSDERMAEGVLQVYRSLVPVL